MNKLTWLLSALVTLGALNGASAQQITRTPLKARPGPAGVVAPQRERVLKQVPTNSVVRAPRHGRLDQRKQLLVAEPRRELRRGTLQRR